MFNEAMNAAIVPPIESGREMAAEIGQEMALTAAAPSATQFLETRRRSSAQVLKGPSADGVTSFPGIWTNLPRIWWESPPTSARPLHR